MVRKMLNPTVTASVIVILYAIMPILSVAISRFITTYAFMILCVVLFAFIMLTGGIERLSALIYILAPAGFYVLFTFITGTQSITILGYQGLLFLLPLVIGYYFFYYRDDTIPFFSKIIVFAIVITAITTIIGTIRFPEASRILATIAESEDPESIKYSWNNIGGYEFVYTCVLLYPVLILAYKQRKVSRVTFLILFLLLLTLIIFAEYTIALLLFMITSILFFVGKKATASQLLITGIVMSAIFFLFQPAFEKFFLWLADIFDSKVFNERLTALAGGVNGIENSESNRIELYNMSINAFIKNPVFGNTFNRSFAGGGHSFILDCLANYGILGGGAILLIYRNVYRNFFAPFKNEQGYAFVIWTFVQAIVLSIVNTNLWLSVLALFAPVLFSAIYDRYESDNYYEDSLDY